MNGSPQNAVRQKATPKMSSSRVSACLAARSGILRTSMELASTNEMVVRMCVSTTAATITEASRQPLRSSTDRYRTASASGSSANESAKENSPAMVLAMLPPQMLNWSTSAGPICFMSRKTTLPQAARMGAGSRRRRILKAAQQVKGSRNGPAAVTTLKAIWLPISGVSAAIDR